MDIAKALQTIEQHGAGFSEAWGALREIRDRKLYRETHATFEQYCRDKWGMTDQLIAIANEPTDPLAYRKN